MRLAIIPARGGSKRIPSKNIRVFAGKPMIAYAISVARASGLFDHVVVSTEDDSIARVAIEWGGEVPFIRPTNLADDHTPTVPVIAHAIGECESLGWNVDWACCIYPCVPFLQVDDLRVALQLLQKSYQNYCFPLAGFPAAIQRALRCDSEGKVSPFFPQNELIRTQDFPAAYYDAGQFYWGAKSAWLTKPKIHSGAVGYPIPSWRVVDIDTLEDWRRAELIFDSLFRNNR